MWVHKAQHVLTFNIA